MREDITIPQFLDLPFDLFVIEQWDASSPLSKNEQKRALVAKWIALGKYGRNKYYLDMTNVSADYEVPPEIPQDLLTGTERASTDLLSNIFWIRTWFGDANDESSQDAADEAYQRLRVQVLQGGDEDNDVDCVEEEFIFENRDELAGVSNPGGPDIADGIALGRPGSFPAYLVSALMHCPDQMEGSSDADWRHLAGAEREEEEEDSEKVQQLLVLVADRKACEEGWVLHLGVNHKGRVLPFRVREKASEAAQNMVNWMEGQPLDEMAEEEGEDREFYMSRGDGWD